MFQRIYITAFFLLFIIQAGANNLLTPFEKSKGVKTATVQECFDFYRQLSTLYPQFVQLIQPTNQPFPLVIVKNEQAITTPLVVMINNAIHPGEPDGVDACMMLVRNICMGRLKLPAQVELHIIPFYNVAGGLRRGSFSRSNQNGPEAYGFRANAQNLDLNRDFVKMDAPETYWFRQSFFYGNRTPDLFIDTHVSNGADYQYTMTLLPTQHNQLGKMAGAYLHDTLVPGIYQLMKQKGHDICPYVNHFSETPDSGWTEFYDSPRFSSGYAAMFNCFAILTETHMLKPFDKRVGATLDALISIIEFGGKNYQAIQKSRHQQELFDKEQRIFNTGWVSDTSNFSWIEFKGYQAGHKPSSISSKDRLYYDRNKPYTKQVKFFDTYQSTGAISMPSAYLVPSGYPEVLSGLQTSNSFSGAYLLERDTQITVEVYTIKNYQTVTRPYEAHYLHHSTTVSTETKTITIPGGTYWLLPLSKVSYPQFVMHVLEPTTPDSYFNWNFFDGILQQKEGYSDYVFEDLAATWLKEHPELQQQLNALKASDPAFAANGAAQLDWVYKHSPYYEGSVNVYPVYRIK